MNRGFDISRVRKKANPFVGDMLKYLRTSQMSVHGSSPFFYCNLKLGLKLQEETVGSSHAEIDQDDAFLAGVLQGAVGRAVCYCFTPVFARRCWAIIHGFPIRQRPRGRPVEVVVYSKQPILWAFEQKQLLRQFK